MKNGEILDETREALIDQLYLIYKYITNAVSRIPPTEDYFDLINIYGESMSVQELQRVLWEFETLCSENPKKYKWNSFPENAKKSHQLFRSMHLNNPEWYLLQDFLKHESIPHLRKKLSPKQGLLRNISDRISAKISHLL